MYDTLTVAWNKIFKYVKINLKSSYAIIWGWFVLNSIIMKWFGKGSLLSKIPCRSPFLPLLFPHVSFTSSPSFIPLYLMLLFFPLIHQIAWRCVSVCQPVCALCLYLFLSKYRDSFVLSIHEMIVIHHLFRIFHQPFMNMSQCIIMLRMLYVIVSVFNTFLLFFLCWLQCIFAWPLRNMWYFQFFCRITLPVYLMLHDCLAFCLNIHCSARDADLRWFRW